MKTYAVATLVSLVHTFWGPWGALEAEPGTPASDLRVKVRVDGPEEAPPDMPPPPNASLGNGTDATCSAGAACGAGPAARPRIPDPHWWSLWGLCDLLGGLSLLAQIARWVRHLTKKTGCCGRREKPPTKLEETGAQTELASTDIRDKEKELEDLKRRLSEESLDSKTMRQRLVKEKSLLEDKREESQLLSQDLHNTRNQLQQRAMEKLDLQRQNQEQAARIKDASMELKNRNAKIDLLKAKNQELANEREAQQRASQAVQRQLQHEKEQVTLKSQRIEELEAEIAVLRAQSAGSEAKADARNDAAEPVEAIKRDASLSERRRSLREAEPHRGSVLHRASEWEAGTSQSSAQARMPIRTSPGRLNPAPSSPDFRASKDAFGRTSKFVPKLSLESLNSDKDTSRPSQTTPSRDPNEQMREKLRLKREKTEARKTCVTYQNGTPSSPADASTASVDDLAGASQRQPASPAGTCTDTNSGVPALPSRSPTAEELEAGEEQSDEEQPGKEQPRKEQPYEEQPCEEQPCEEQPCEEQPGEEQPGEEQPGEEQPGEEQPGDGGGAGNQEAASSPEAMSRSLHRERRPRCQNYNLADDDSDGPGDVSDDDNRSDDQCAVPSPPLADSATQDEASAAPHDEDEQREEAAEAAEEAEEEAEEEAGQQDAVLHAPRGARPKDTGIYAMSPDRTDPPE